MSSASIGGKGTFAPGTTPEQGYAVMAGLDGSWKVERMGGLLPPLYGVRKEIRGKRGETKIGPLPGVPFDVVGHELRYRGPLRVFVDVLEQDGEGFRGRATFRGREYGRFRLVPR
jgi:hypothetical protein